MADHDSTVDEGDIDRRQTAVETLNEGELGPFVSRIAEDTIWTGQGRAWLSWRHSRNLQGPDETRAVLTGIKYVCEREGITGSVRLVPGTSDRAVLEFRQDSPPPFATASTS